MNAVTIPDERLETFALKMLDHPQVKCNVRHIFGPGIYMRELSVAAGSFIVGHWHKTAHQAMLVKGRMRLMKADGSVEEIAAPCTFLSMPGRKAAFVLEDSVFVNIHATDETDVDTLETMLLDKTEMPVKQIEYKDDGEYASMLADIGMTAERVRELSINEDDCIPFPPGAYKCKVGPSPIEGKGLFATSDIEAGESICFARIGDKRTPAGRYMNHSATPNARFVEHDGDVYVIATRDISGSMGGYDGEEITVNYRNVDRAKLELIK